MIDAVPVYCMANSPQEVCNKCSKICEGDYWKLDNSVLCHRCWVESRVFTDEYTVKLKKYKVKVKTEIFPLVDCFVLQKVRTCSFMHNHEGTTAGVWTAPRNKLVKKIRLENYLYLYSNCWDEKIAR